MSSSSSQHNIIINIEAKSQAKSEIDGVKRSVNELDGALEQQTRTQRNSTKEGVGFGTKVSGAYDKVSGTLKTTGSNLQSYGNKHKTMSVVATAGLAKMAQKNSEYGKTVVAVTQMSDEFTKEQIKSGEANAKVREEVDKLAQSYTTMSKQDIAEQYLEVARAGFVGADATKILEASMKLSTATGEDLGNMTEILIRSMGAFGLGAESAGEAATILASSANASTSDVSDMIPALNMVGTVAHANGISFKETADAIAFMHDKGIQASTGSRSLRTVLAGLNDSASKQTETFAELGMELEDGRVKFDSLADFVDRYQTATEGMTDAQKKDIATKVAGKEAFAGFLALTSETGEAVDEFGNKVEGSNKNLADFSKETAEFTEGDLNNLKDSMQDADSWGEFKAQLENASLGLATALAPSIEAVLDKLTDFATKLQDPEYAKHVADLIEMGVKYLAFTQVVGVAGGAMKTMGTIMSGAKTIVGLFGGGATKAVPAVTALGSSGKLAGTLLGAMTSPVGLVVGAIGLLVGAFILAYTKSETFRDIVNGAVKAVVEFVKNPIESLKKAFTSIGKTMEKVGKAIDKVWQGIKGVFKRGSDDSSKSTKKMADDVEKDTSKANKSAKKNADGIGKDIDSGTKKGAESSGKNTAKIASDMEKNMSNASKSAGRGGKNASKEFENGIRSMPQIARRIAMETANSLTSGLSGINLHSQGYSAMSSFASGLNSGMGQVYSAVSRARSSASSMKSAYNSPYQLAENPTGEQMFSMVGSTNSFINNPMGAKSGGNIQVSGDFSSNAQMPAQSDVTVVIYETFDGDKIVRKVNTTNTRSKARIKTVRQ